MNNLFCERNESFVCAYCANVFKTEPFKLNCGNIICKFHLNSIEYGSEFKCLLCNDDHLYEEDFDLSYKKAILIPRYKHMLADVKSRLEFYQTIAKNPTKFIQNNYGELIGNFKNRKLINQAYKLTEDYNVNILNVESNFKDEFQKFSEFLKTSQINYAYYIYAQKLMLINLIMERKIDKAKDVIENKIRKSIILEKIFGKNLDNNQQKSDQIITFDSYNQAKIWNVNELKCLNTINLNNFEEFLYDTNEYLKLLEANDKKLKIFSSILNYFIHQNKKFLNNQSIFCATISSFKTINDLMKNYFIFGSDNGQVSIWNLEDNEDKCFLSFKCGNSNVCAIEHCNDEFNLLIACGLNNGDFSIFKISKEDLYFNKNLISKFEKLHDSIDNSRSVKNIKIFKIGIILNTLIVFSDGTIQKYEQISDSKFDFLLTSEAKFETFTTCEILDENFLSLGFENGKIKIFNLQSQINVCEINAHENRVNFLKSKNSFLLSLSDDKCLKVWDVKTAGLKSQLNMAGYSIVKLEFV